MGHEVDPGKLPEIDRRVRLTHQYGAQSAHYTTTDEEG